MRSARSGRAPTISSVKPVQMEELKIVLQRCVYVAELEQEYRAMQQGQRAGRVRRHVGQQPADANRFYVHPQGGADRAPVLILGESGTGKEMVAQAIHRLQPAERTGRSSRSIATPFRRTCSRASCSDTRRAPSPARTPSARVTSNRRREARCSSTRSASCRRRCR